VCRCNLLCEVGVGLVAGVSHRLRGVLESGFSLSAGFLSICRVSHRLVLELMLVWLTGFEFFISGFGLVFWV